jgi:hypothetical protein
MRKLAALLLLVAGLSAAAVEAASAPEKPKSHGNSLSGTIARVDAKANTFVVRVTSGAETTLVRTKATRVQGAGLSPGDRVAVRWLEKDGRKIATSVRVETAALAAATPTASAGTR